MQKRTGYILLEVVECVLIGFQAANIGASAHFSSSVSDYRYTPKVCKTAGRQKRIR